MENTVYVLYIDSSSEDREAVDQAFAEKMPQEHVLVHYADVRFAVSAIEEYDCYPVVVLGTTNDETDQEIERKLKMLKDASPARTMFVVYAATPPENPVTLNVNVIAAKPDPTEFLRAVMPLVDIVTSQVA